MSQKSAKSSLLWRLIESRDQTIAKGIKKWDEQDEEIILLRKTLEERNKESDEKDEEIRSLKAESNEKDEEIQEKDKEITVLKKILDIRVEKLKELERIRSSWPYRIVHMIRHPENLFKKKI